jgi:hypothetical protein
MIFTLQRYIFREAFKVFVLAAVALTLIMSLGSIVRPVQEYGVGPRQALHLIGCVQGKRRKSADADLSGPGVGDYGSDCKSAFEFLRGAGFRTPGRKGS